MINNQVENDTVKVNIHKLIIAIDHLKKYCFEEMRQNNIVHSNILKLLAEEAWIGKDNLCFLEINETLLANMKVVERFYENTIRQLEKIRDEMSEQMQERVDIHVF